jgi:threonine dehydrogenase-like Zn-dependent dehydrogenase
MIGCGSIGQIHAVGLAELAGEGYVRPVVAMDPSEEAREAAHRNCPFEALVPDAERPSATPTSRPCS